MKWYTKGPLIKLTMALPWDFTCVVTYKCRWWRKLTIHIGLIIRTILSECWWLPSYNIISFSSYFRSSRSLVLTVTHRSMTVHLTFSAMFVISWPWKIVEFTFMIAPYMVQDDPQASIQHCTRKKVKKISLFLCFWGNLLKKVHIIYHVSRLGPRFLMLWIEVSNSWNYFNLKCLSIFVVRSLFWMVT